MRIKRAMIPVLMISLILIIISGCREKEEIAGLKGIETKSIDSNLRIKTDCGEIYGFYSSIDNNITGFKGIPYAEPPVGDLRWKMPVPVKPWIMIKDCTSDSPRCPQTEYGGYYQWFDSGPAPMSEDCLYLNIWTDSENKDRKKPVMVWIHGGALTRGSNNSFEYDGTGLAKKGVVLVTINYRLGIFGFLAHEELSRESQEETGIETSGNYGLMDQIEALRWVRRNIENFGGDKDNVTIFGESAGGWSVSLLAASPLSKGLFNKVISQSGSVFSGDITDLKKSGRTYKSAEEKGAAFVDRIIPGENENKIELLRKYSYSELLKYSADYNSFHQSSGYHTDAYVLPGKDYEAFLKTGNPDISLLIGINKDEGPSLFHIMKPGTKEKLIGYFKWYNYPDEIIEELLDVYDYESDENADRVFYEYQRDLWFFRPMNSWSEVKAANGGKVYQYFFTHAPEQRNKAWNFLGAYHSSEIPYIFGTAARKDIVYKNDDAFMEDLMSGYWTNFAKTGNPNGSGLPNWEPYTTEKKAYYILDSNGGTDENLLQRQVELLDRILKPY